MPFVKAFIAASQLVHCTEPHYAWRCPGCWLRLDLKFGDERANSGKAPRCKRCNQFTAPINGEPKPVVD